MRRCISALAAGLLLALTGGVANAYAGGTIGAPALGQENAVQSAPSTSVPQPPVSQSQAPAQANNADSEQASGVLGAANVQTGLNNNTVQLGSGNESNGNTNTVGDQTAVNGNNLQQSNESTTQPRSGGACCATDGRSDESNAAGQQNSARNEQASFVAKAANVQTGLNNNTVQLGSGNESNHNTNTAGDQTAVNGNNFQQSNEQTSSAKGDWKRDDWKRDDCHSGCKTEKPRCECSRPGAENESNGNTNTVGDQTAVNGNNFQQSNESKGDWKSPGGSQQNRAHNEQYSLVLGAANLQTGLNNNTVQVSRSKEYVGSPGRTAPVDGQGGGGNESNGNTNTAGDQTAVNGNNFQQSNESSGGSGGDWKRSSPGGSQENEAGNHQGAIVLGAANIQTGLNNNTVQLGSGNESNGNTNTAGDQTAVNGNNFQQSNEQTGSPKGDWKGGDWKGSDCHSSCEPKPEKCEPKPKCPEDKRPEHSSQPADQSNRASNEQGAIVIGGLNVQTGLNNNTVQLGYGNESNHNTNTAGDQTAVNGNNFQQTNTRSLA